MGQIKFRVASPDILSAARLEHSYAVDAMLVSYAVGTSIDDDEITIDLPCNESCHFFFPWPTACGDLILCTTSLRVSERPYEYEIELARGTIGRLLAKFAFWHDPEIEFSEALIRLISECRSTLIKAIFHTDAGDRANAACTAIDLAIESIQRLVEEYIRLVRPRENQPMLASFGVVCRECELNGMSTSSALQESLSTEETARLKADETQRIHLKKGDCPPTVTALAGQIDMVFLPVPGLQIDSNVSQALVQIAQETQRIFKRYNFSSDQSAGNPCAAVAPGVGPILNWTSHAIDQLFRTEKNFDKIRDSLYVSAKTIVENLPKPVNSFYVAAGVGARRDKKFNDHQRLQLTLDAMSGIYKSAPDLPLLVSFHQPIGGEIDNDPLAISPLHGADALLRADVGLQMIGLEISFATFELPSTRELLQVNELVDVWSEFGLPLFVLIQLAPACEPREASQPLLAGLKRGQQGRGSQSGLLSAGVEVRKATKQKFDYGEFRRVVSLLQSKSAVHGLFFSAAEMPLDSQPESSQKARLEFQEIISRVITELKSSKI